MIKRKILSLFLAVTMLTPVVGSMSSTAFAETGGYVFGNK